MPQRSISPLSLSLAVVFCLGLRISRTLAVEPELYRMLFSIQLVTVLGLWVITLWQTKTTMGAILKRADAFWYISAMILATQLISAAMNGIPLQYNYRFAVSLTLPLLYPLFRCWSEKDIQVGAGLALPAFLILSYGVENSNVIAFSTVGLIILSCRENIRLAFALLLAAMPYLVLKLTCRGALLGLFGAFLGSCSRIRIGIMLGAAALTAAVGLYLDSEYPSLTHFRDQMARQAFGLYQTSPLWGVGPGHTFSTYLNNGWVIQSHSHNLVMTIAAETGSLGLAVLAGLLITIARKWKSFPVWSRMLIGAFLIWSFFDEPLQWWMVNNLFWIALSRADAPADDAR
ncbi:MAG: hypothetical protein U0136_08640 [Bdellovibrionota bacterium]